MPTRLMELSALCGSSSALRPQCSLRLEKVSKVIAPNESKLTLGGRVPGHAKRVGNRSSKGGKTDRWRPAERIGSQGL